MDLFSLYVLFSHFRPCDVTPGNSFFQMSSSARAYGMHNVCKNKKKIPLGTSLGLKWENKTYKLKRSIEENKLSGVRQRKMCQVSLPGINGLIRMVNFVLIQCLT